MRNLMKNRGFTLVELMVAMAIGLAILGAIYASINIAQRSSVGVTRKVVTQQDARTVLDIMAMEIRMASFNPSMTPDLWTIPVHAPLCAGLILVRANKGIQSIGSSRLAIAMDLDNSGVIADSDNEYIVYQYNDADTITRNVNCQGSEIFLGGNLDSGTQVRNAEAGVNLFQYYDKGGNLTASIPDIRRIRVTIVADTKNPSNMIRDSVTGKAKATRMVYSTDILVKNHVLCP